MADNNNPRSSTRRDDHGFLSRIDVKELNTINVKIKRPYIPNSGLALPITRTLGDPKELSIHFREDEGLRPIFDRPDILVNQKEERINNRVILTTAQENESSKSTRSYSHSKSKSRSPRRSRSYSPRERSRKSPYEGRNWAKANKPHKYRSSRETTVEIHRKRSRTPLRPGEYRPTSRDKELERYNRKRSISPLKSGYNRKRSKSPLKPGEYRPSSRERYRQQKNRSKSPLKRGEYRPSSRERYLHRKRSRSPRKSRSLSPQRQRRKSPSPSTSAYRKSPSPSTSRYARFLPARHDSKISRKYRSPSPARSSSRVTSRQIDAKSKSHYHAERGSPSRYEAEHRKRISRSPPSSNRYDRFRGKSPSRSPEKSRSRRRSQNRSEKRSRSRSNHVKRGAVDHGGMQGFPYFEGHEFWVPAPLRPGFLPRVYPGAFPRIMPPMMYPRMVMPYPPHYRPPKLPVYNNRNILKITENASHSTSTVNAASDAVGGGNENVGDEDAGRAVVIGGAVDEKKTEKQENGKSSEQSQKSPSDLIEDKADKSE